MAQVGGRAQGVNKLLGGKLEKLVVDADPHPALAQFLKERLPPVRFEGRRVQRERHLLAPQRGQPLHVRRHLFRGADDVAVASGQLLVRVFAPTTIDTVEDAAAADGQPVAL